jgi:hypothetical protein
MENRQPDHPDSRPGGPPRGYPPGRFPNDPPAGGFAGVSGATALVRLASLDLGRSACGPVALPHVSPFAAYLYPKQI